MAPRAVIFDLDDTLMVDEAATRAAFSEAARHAAQFGADVRRLEASVCRLAAEIWKTSPHYEFCDRIGINDAECLWGDFGNQTPELAALDSWAKKFRIQVFDQALQEQGIKNAEAAARLASVFAEARIREGRLFPDALEVLTTLHAKFPLAILTNGAPDVQSGKILRAGIAGFFHTIVISGNHAAGKPSPEIFRFILGQLDVQANEAVMVGNSMARDILGASNVGISTVWLRVPGAEEFADCKPDFVIHHLAELPQILLRQSD